MGYKGVLKEIYHTGYSSTYVVELYGNTERLNELKGLEIEAELKAYKSKRSIEQNALLWGLIHEIDRKENGHASDEMAVYTGLIKQANIRTEWLQMTEQGLEIMRSKRIFRHIEVVEERETPKGKALICKCYYGSSTFDTKEMTDFIKATLDRAERVGIDTLRYSDLKHMVKEG